MPSLPEKTLPRKLPPQQPSSSRFRGPIAETDLPFYRRSRAAVYAVGVAVIASSGALLGAHLKTWWQARESARVAEVGVDGGSATVSQAIGRQGGAPAAPAAAAGGGGGNATGGKEIDVKADLRDLERSITTLQNRRGQLVQRRMQEEARLAGLRERIAKRVGQGPKQMSEASNDAAEGR